MSMAYTLSPGESSVYNLSMVFDDPPAPAARDELGRDACVVPAARRLFLFVRKEAIIGYVETYRIWAPGGLATVELAPRPLTRGVSESD